MRFFGGQPVDMGNAGAIQAQSNLFAGSPSFQIGPRSPFKGMSQEELNKLKEWDSRPGDLQKYYEQQNQPGPRLPFASLPGAFGNMGRLVAQAQSPGAALGASALGGGVGMNTQQMQQYMQNMQQQQPGSVSGPLQMGAPQQQQAGPNVFSFRPNMKLLNPEEGGLQFGGSLNIPLGENARINATGAYLPETNTVNLTGTVGQPQGQPGFGVDFFVNRRLNQKQATPLGVPGLGDTGAYARYSGRF